MLTEQRTDTAYKEQIQDLTWVSISIDMRNSDLFLVSVSVPHLYRYGCVPIEFPVMFQ